MAVTTVRNDMLAPSAGAGSVADAGDVSGNNIPLGGGNHVSDAITVEGTTFVAGVTHDAIAPAGTAAGVPDGGPVASGDDGHQAGQGDAGYGGHSVEHNARPVPTFWNFVENELAHQHANNNHHQSELMWHHA